MPPIIDKRDVAASMIDVANIRFSYDYPLNMPLRPRTEFHDALRDRLVQLARDSRNSVGVRHQEWRKVDESLRTYSPPERLKRFKKTDKLYGESEWDLMPEVIMPVTLAAMESMLGFMTAAFLEEPLFAYSGVGPEDILPTMLLQADIEQQTRQAAMSLPLHTMFRDGLAYGAGFISPRWHVEEGYRTEVVPTLDGRQKIRRFGIIHEGNVLDSVNPYLALPDPNISVHELKEAEYFAWIEETSYTKLASMEQSGNFLFNVRYLNYSKRRSQFTDTVGRGRQGEQTVQKRGSYNKPIDVLWVYVQLVPREWPDGRINRKLGSSHYPELWLFGLANDDVIIAAEPIETDWAKIPVIGCAPDYDGYNIFALSRLWSINDLQRLIDFMFTSHVQNVRRSINNRFIVDPMMIYMPDLVANKPFIRTQRRLWGQGKVTDGIEQLKVDDLTRNNVADVQFLRDYAFDAVGAPDRRTGTQNRGPRVSAEAIRGVVAGAASQMERLAKVIDSMSMRPLAEQLARNTIQFRTISHYVRLSGDIAKRLQEEFGVNVAQDRAMVTPLDLVADFDVEARSGAIPGTADLRTLVELFQVASQSPFVLQELNIAAFFKQIARQAGLKQLDLLVKQAQAQPPQVMPDEQVENQVQQGNLIPTATLPANGATPAPV